MKLQSLIPALSLGIASIGCASKSAPQHQDEAMAHPTSETNDPPTSPANDPRDAAVTERINLERVGFEKRMLTTSVGEVAVFEAGEGEPLLLLHGVGAGASSYIWFTVAPELAKHYRVIAPDFIGWGESSRPARYLLFKDYVQQIRELGDSLGEPAYVVTQSLTSGFVLEAMRDGELSVKGLVMGSPSGGLDFGVDSVGPQATAFFSSIADSPRRDEIYAEIFHRKPAVEDWWRQRGFFDPQAVPESLIEASHFNAKQPNASYSALPFLSGKIRYDIVPYLQDISVPAKMIWGAHETQISPALWQRIEKVNPDIVSARIPDARSTFEVEKPEQTLKEILTFLKDA